MLGIGDHVLGTKLDALDPAIVTAGRAVGAAADKAVVVGVEAAAVAVDKAEVVQGNGKVVVVTKSFRKHFHYNFKQLTKQF